MNIAFRFLGRHFLLTNRPGHPVLVDNFGNSYFQWQTIEEDRENGSVWLAWQMVYMLDQWKDLNDEERHLCQCYAKPLEVNQ